MRIREIKQLVRSSADATFAIDSNGSVVATNSALQEMLGFAEKDMLGKACSFLISGKDECGEVCSSNCVILQAIRARRPLKNFDLHIKTNAGYRWCNISVFLAEDTGSVSPFAIHVIRDVDTRKRMEIVVRDFVVTGTGLPKEQIASLFLSTRAPARECNLSKQELTVLKLLAKGVTTAKVAEQLHISPTTVNNHVQNILKKLDVHTRLEAIRRAEQAGLL
jgi:PAS domain S-box-containing protein